MDNRMQTFSLSQYPPIRYTLPNATPNPVSDPTVALIWKNLTVFRQSFLGKNTSPILCNLKGQINFGTITALMGPSGAGKTTLLRCVNGMNRKMLSDDSQIYVPASQPIFRCFIVQDVKEHLLMSLTVRESLKYASRLKNRGQSKIAKLMNAESDRFYDNWAHIEKLVIDLMLNDCMDNVISLCSGGEQKRLIIAIELTSRIKPNLICIDEPTSGLDSYAAEQTIDCLQKIARKHNLAMVCSIHQPNSDVLIMFDQLYVLAKGGRAVYSGPPNLLRDHLMACNIQCLEYQTPIEVLLKVASRNIKDFSRSNLGANLNNFSVADIDNLVAKTSEKLSSLDRTSFNTMQLSDGLFNDIPRYFHPTDMWHLFCRTAIYSWFREWKTNAFLFFALISSIVLIVLVYRDDIGTDPSCLVKVNGTYVVQVDYEAMITSRQESLPEQNLKFLYIMTIYITIIQISATVFTFSTEIKMFLNEHRNKWYSSGSYYWAKTIAELPLLLIITYGYSWIAFYGTSQPDMDDWYNAVWHIPERFALFTLFLTVTVLNAQGLAMFCSILFVRNHQIAVMVALSGYFGMILFCGFLVPINSFCQFVQKLTHLAFTKFFFKSALLIIYGRGRCAPNLSLITIMFDTDDDDFWTNFGWLLGHLVGWRLMALITLIVKANADWLARFWPFKRNDSSKDEFVYVNQSFNDYLP